MIELIWVVTIMPSIILCLLNGDTMTLVTACRTRHLISNLTEINTLAQMAINSGVI